MAIAVPSWTKQQAEWVLQRDFERARSDAEQIARFALPVIAITPAGPGTPPCYMTNVEISKGVVKPVAYYYVTRDEEIFHFMQWAHTLAVLGYDTETSDIDPLDGKLATIQLGNPLVDDARVYVMDVRCLTIEALEPVLRILTEKEVVKLGANMKFECKWTQYHLGTPVRNVIDTQVNEQVIRGGLFQKKGAEASADRQDRAAYKYCSLAALSMRYLKLDIDKDHDLRTSFYRTRPGCHTLRQILYAGSDVIYPFYVARAQKVHIEARKLRSIIVVESRLIPVLADMELTGFRIDVERWRKLWQEAVKKRADAERALDEIMLSLQGDLFVGSDANVRPIYLGNKKPVPLNYSSSDQVKWALRQYCEKTGWTHRLLTTPGELAKVKRVEGREWLEKAQAKFDEKAARGEVGGTRPTEKDIPDYVVPEDRYCVLLSAKRDVLILGLCRKQLPTKFVELLLEYSTYDIRCDTFGNDFLRKHLRQDTGCVHTEFHQCVTATGRLSCSPNIQNIPRDKRYRRCFIPKPGYVFVTADFSQIEPRITAQQSKDPVYVKTFLTDDDIYLAVAEAMLGHRPDIHAADLTVKERAKLDRAIFKTVVLALAYAMGPGKLRDRLTLALYKEIMQGLVPAPTFAYAKELYDRFFEVHAGVREQQARAVEQGRPVDDDGVPNPRRIWDDYLGAEVTWVTAPCGRKRFFPPDAKAVWTEAPNVGPQAGSATITKAAAVLLQDHIWEKGYDAHMVNLVHDEIVAEVREDQAEQFAVEMKEIVERAGQYYTPDIPIKAEFPEGTQGITPFWAKGMEKADWEELAMEVAA